MNDATCFNTYSIKSIAIYCTVVCRASFPKPVTQIHRNYLTCFLNNTQFSSWANMKYRIECYTATLGRVHTTRLGPERFRNATGRPCSHLFHCVRSFRNEPTTSRCDRSGTVPERVRLALWCERATGPVPEPFQLPVTFVDSQPILHISKRSSLHGILPQIV